MKYQVISVHEVDASSPAEAAYVTYRRQKEMAAAEASFRVGIDESDFQTVRISDAAPIERLTDREREVARLIMEGATNNDIAETLGITPRTVKAHIGHSFEKLGVSNRVAMATMLLRQQARCMA